MQATLNAVILATLFFRTTLHQRNVDDANLYGGVLFFSLIAMLFNNFAEFSLIVQRLAVRRWQLNFLSLLVCKPL